MRAAVVVEPGRVEVVDVPAPVPGPGQVLVDMQYASVCGSDVHMVFDGMHDPEQLGRPGWPGHEGVGVVAESRHEAVPVGAAVLTVPAGREGGCFADRQVVDGVQVLGLPAGVDSRRLLLAQALGTTIFGMRAFLGDGTAPRTAAVIGAGSAGLFFVQQLRDLGVAPLVVSDHDARRLATARRLGATHTVPAGGLVDAVHELTAGRGVDLVVEAAGYDVCRAEAVEAAREHGTVGLFGYPERRGLSPFPVERAFRRSLALRCINGTQREPGLRSFREALAAIADGRVGVDHCLEHMVDLDDAADALAAARDHGRGAAKVGFVLGSARVGSS